MGCKLLQLINWNNQKNLKIFKKSLAFRAFIVYHNDEISLYYFSARFPAQMCKCARIHIQFYGERLWQLIKDLASC